MSAQTSITTPPITPGTKIKMPVGAWIMLTLSLGVSMGSGIGSFIVLQQKVTTTETHVEKLETRLDTLQAEFIKHGDLLSRIDERLAIIQRERERASHP